MDGIGLRRRSDVCSTRLSIEFIISPGEKSEQGKYAYRSRWRDNHLLLWPLCGCIFSVRTSWQDRLYPVAISLGDRVHVYNIE